MKFYDLKERSHVEVSDSEVTKVRFAKGTKRERYAFVGVVASGRKLYKFCKKDDFDASSVKEVDA